MLAALAERAQENYWFPYIIFKKKKKNVTSFSREVKQNKRKRELLSHSTQSLIVCSTVCLFSSFSLGALVYTSFTLPAAAIGCFYE